MLLILIVLENPDIPPLQGMHTLKLWQSEQMLQHVYVCKERNHRWKNTCEDVSKKRYHTV